MKCLFCQIADKTLPAQIVYENDQLVAFNDIQPQAPHHILIIPRLHIASLEALTPSHLDLPGHLLLAAQHLARTLGFADQGYRTVINCRDWGGQTVQHLHVHLLGGRPLHWPPG